MTQQELKAPFPWFGGKSRVADIVWSRFGDVANYVEPFAGSLAVLLARPTPPKVETVNDKDCYLANFWRALQADPDAVAHHADWPVNEADLHARHLWLVQQEGFRERMMSDPEYYDAKIAGWWVWGLCQWIGSGWCDTDRYERSKTGKTVQQIPDVGTQGRGMDAASLNSPSRRLPHLSDSGTGVHRPSHRLPSLGDLGRGVHRAQIHTPQQIPLLSSGGMGIHSPAKQEGLYEYFHALADRLRRVRVCCGEWDRILGPSVTEKLGVTGIFLDPPYEGFEGLYAAESGVSGAVREWAIANGSNKMLRIALCGYEGEHSMPGDWECVPWKAQGGYGSQGIGQGRENAGRERIWFSPACLKVGTMDLFSQAA